MKIAFLMRGPIRPSESYVLENLDFMINTSLQNIDNKNITTFIVTSEYNSILNYFDNSIILKRFSDEKIFELINSNHMNNAFNQFYSSKTAIELITKLESFDFIIHTRTDIKVDISNLENEWFKKDTYQTIHIGDGTPAFEQNSLSYHCDHFSIAEPEIMLKAWNYHSFNLLKIFFANSNFPERILDFIIQINNVKSERANIRYWECKNKIKIASIEETMKWRKGSLL